MIRLTLAKAEVELEVIEPGDAGIDVFAFEDLGQVLVMGFEQVRMGGIVEGDEDRVVANADIAVDAAEDGGGEPGELQCFRRLHGMGLEEIVNTLIGSDEGQAVEEFEALWGEGAGSAEGHDSPRGLVHELQGQAGREVGGGGPGPAGEQIPGSQAQVFGCQPPEADEIAGNLIRQELADAACEAAGVELFAAILADGAEGFQFHEGTLGVERIEFFLKPELSDDAIDGAFTDAEVTRAEFLRDDFGAGFGIQKAVTDHLADEFLGATIVGSGAAFGAEESGAAFLQEEGAELEVTLPAKAEWGGGAVNALRAALALDEHGELAGDFIVGGKGQGADGARDTLFEKLPGQQGRPAGKSASISLIK